MPPICIHYDSQYPIGRAQNNMYNGRSKHIRRRHNTIRQLLSTRVIFIAYVKSNDNIVNPLTKWLNRELVEKPSRGMRLKAHKRISQDSGYLIGENVCYIKCVCLYAQVHASPQVIK